MNWLDYLNGYREPIAATPRRQIVTNRQYGAVQSGGGDRFVGGGRGMVTQYPDRFDPTQETGEEFLRRLALMKYLAEKGQALEK